MGEHHAPAPLRFRHPALGDVEMVMVDLEPPRFLSATCRLGDAVCEVDLMAPPSIAPLQDIAALPRNPLPGRRDAGDHLGGEVERTFAHRRLFSILRRAAERTRDGIRDVYIKLAQASRRYVLVRVLGHAHDENTHHLSNGKTPGFVRSPDFSLREGWCRPAVLVCHVLRSVRSIRAGLKGDGPAATGHPRKPNGARDDMGEAE
ncbi:hypothetical protein [Ancylobacter polymorphus]|uniref:Uncharacterized protein n=1 Tax=Ancylobacter polymorphus TaxID=223390 RepID=A0ABU0BLG1_9HYPH|nr:hypothetical protein [Ancylobacter polymorphus]MDQ0305304.1 hypothetical protein [Ancylobacter polymorphus]